MGGAVVVCTISLRGRSRGGFPPSSKHALCQGEKHVGVQRTLVCLIEHEGAVVRQLGRGDRLAKEDAVGGERDACALRGGVLEAHSVTHLVSHAATHLLGHTLGRRDRGHAARLRHAHSAVPGAGQELRQLCRLARAGLADHDHTVVHGERGKQRLALRQEWQVGRRERHNAAFGKEKVRADFSQIPLG